MARFNNLTIILIVILNVHIIYSSDLLNITKETIDLGQKIVHEVEEKTTYRNFDDVVNKLDKINKIFLKHGKNILQNNVTILEVFKSFHHTIWYSVSKEVYNIKKASIDNNPFFDIMEDRMSTPLSVVTFLNDTQIQKLDAETKFNYIKKVFFEYSNELKENILNLTTKPSTNEKMIKLHKLHQTIDVETNETFVDVLSRLPVSK